MSSARVWFLSPSIATAVFFAIQLGLSLTAEDTTNSVSAAAADAPSAVPVKVRVVAQIEAASKAAPATPVPTTEHELFELFDRDGAVTFAAEEVDVVATRFRKFETSEVEVIRADASARSARLAKP